MKSDREIKKSSRETIVEEESYITSLFLKNYLEEKLFLHLTYKDFAFVIHRNTVRCLMFIQSTVSNRSRAHSSVCIYIYLDRRKQTSSSVRLIFRPVSSFRYRYARSNETTQTRKNKRSSSDERCL